VPLRSHLPYPTRLMTPCTHNWWRGFTGADIKVGHCPSCNQTIRSCQRYVVLSWAYFHRDCLVPVPYPAAS
jgi:hypothetical protein